MTIPDKLRRLDNRVFGRSSSLTRQRARRLGLGLLVLAVLFYVGSYWDGTLGRSAATMALFAGVLLGRVQEHDAAGKGRGLRDHLEQP